MPLDSGFRRNDEKGRRLKFVSPAKAGVQSRGFKWPDPQIDGAYLIMDSLVILKSDVQRREGCHSGPDFRRDDVWMPDLFFHTAFSPSIFLASSGVAGSLFNSRAILTARDTN